MTQILIVDDEPRLLDSLTVILDANQYEVKTASCGQDALTLLTQNQFDLAILDLHLPDKPGVEIMDDIKAYSPDTLVIFITGEKIPIWRSPH
jgi:DNA-binding response OmpR family regulator